MCLQLNITSHLSSKTKRLVHSVSLQCSKKASLKLALQPITMIGFATRSWFSHAEKNTQVVDILPFKHVFCVLVVVVWGCCVLGMELIISIQIYRSQTTLPGDYVCMILYVYCVYGLLGQGSFCPFAV